MTDNADMNEVRTRLKTIQSIGGGLLSHATNALRALDRAEHAEPAPHHPEPEPEPEPTPEPTPEPAVCHDPAFDGDVRMLSGGPEVGPDPDRKPLDPWRLKVGTVTFIAAKADQSPRPGYIITGNPIAGELRGNIDPIVNSGGTSHHAHTFVGVSGWMTDEELSTLTCPDITEHGIHPSRIVAWMPTADAPLRGNTGYVENRHGEPCEPLPSGLVAITDNGFWKDERGRWSAVLKTGDWWDGRLDSPDHRSHLSSTRTATHTRRIPEIRWHWTFERAFEDPRPTLSSEPMHGLHMDVMVGDDPRMQQAMTDHILNQDRTMGRMLRR